MKIPNSTKNASEDRGVLVSGADFLQETVLRVLTKLKSATIPATVNERHHLVTNCKPCVTEFLENLILYLQRLPYSDFSRRQ